MAAAQVDVAAHHSNGVTGAAELRDLDLKIDHLLAQYLHLLDQYTRARAQLQQQLAAGFIALADANFTAPRGVRYGQDFYDDRMQAIRTVSLDRPGDLAESSEGGNQPDSAADGMLFRLKRSDHPSDGLSTTANGKAESSQEVDSTDHASAETKNEPGVSDLSSAGDEVQIRDGKEGAGVSNESTAGQEAPAKAPTNDPLRWYGMFASPKLKAAQSRFAEAVETSSDQLVNVDKQMKLLEVEIRRQRKYRAKAMRSNS